jgi:predicted nucleotidyltransferase component of viral defense system
MSFEEFSGLRLAGGTALALQKGHRRSVDLDLFGEIDFEHIQTPTVFAGFKNVTVLKSSKNINIYSIEGIKVDFVNYAYPWLEEYSLTEGVRLAGTKDIAAMKLAAITGRGSKKDFTDIYFLLQEYSLKEMMGFYNEKYFDGSEFLVLKSLAYFADAEKDADLDMLVDVSWDKIKRTILDHLHGYHTEL